MQDRRFIEVTFPIREVSEESAREKSIRQGHISTLHIWWARRPLASSRATNFAALIPATKHYEEAHKKKEFIIKLSKWDNSLNGRLLAEARKTILDSNDGEPPRILDPFAGGGAIPLEAFRLGCETHASDYNPVAVLILKCTLEYLAKYGRSSGKTSNSVLSELGRPFLLEDVRKWGEWVVERTKKDMSKFYQDEQSGSVPIGYIWARTIPCQNPSCNADIPLMRQYWLVKKDERKVSLMPDIVQNKVTFKIVGTDYGKMPSSFNPDKGTISRAIASCLVCGSTVDDTTVRCFFNEGRMSERMIAVVSHENRRHNKYRLSQKHDIVTFTKAKDCLGSIAETIRSEWGMEPVPDEPMNRNDPTTVAGRGYDFTKWGQLFNARQQLALVTLVKSVRDAYDSIIAEGVDGEYARAIVTYLALVIDRVADYNSTLTRWVSRGEYVGNTLTRQAIPMVWDYLESNPWSEFTGSFESALNWVCKVIEHGLSIPIQNGLVPEITQSSAGNLRFPDNYFDAVFTDPPYYDNVEYAELSDFFYVWLKRSVGHLYPELFSTPLVPKSEEIVSNPSRNDEAKQFFEDSLSKALGEINRVLKPGAICVLVYAHKSTAGWETLVNSLLDSGLVVTGAWPIHTEMKTRLTSRETAALASSIYMIARKFEKEDVGFYKEVKDSLKRHLEGRLDRLWNEGISGADFFIAAIGSSIEVFGKYEKIIDDEGNVVRADRLLEDIRRIVTDYAVKQVLHNGIAGEITPLTRFYVLWRWGYGDVKLEFDDALKLARGVGIDITEEWNRGFIKKDKEFVRILGPEDRNSDQLEGSHELIDVLHHVLLLWNKGKNDEAVNILKETGFGKSDVFYRVAQAISESLPNGREKKLLEVFLSGKERITEHVRKESVQTRLSP